MALTTAFRERNPLSSSFRKRVLNAITSKLSSYGSAIHSDVATVNALKVHGASGVTPGTFRDLQAR